jgi:nuclear GTP-binding protein
MKVGKPTSKRVSTRLHHNIKKKSAEKQRKDRKAAKKNPQWVSRLKKDPGIPNSYPFKAQVLAEIEEHKLRKEAEQQEKRDTAKARREGRAVVEVAPGPSGRAAAGAMEMDGDLVDMEGDEAMDDGNSNPMAALLASAQARALEHADELDDDDEDDGEEDEEVEAGQRGVAVEKKKAPAQKAVAVKKVLPKQALADPIKAVRALMENMEKTEDGVQRLVDYYGLAPIVTAHSDLPTRFLVDVARKRGRLGRGGVPNLHAASLVVLNDINEDRVRLPTVRETKKVGPKGKSQVTIVQSMAEPFKIAGLWGDDNAADAMAVEA